MHARAREHYWQGHGSLSIKSFPQGGARYEVGGGHVAVGEGEYLILNRGQEYTVSVESETPVESFCVFLDDDFAADVFRSLTSTTERLLDYPKPAGESFPNFFERSYPHDDLVSPSLQCLRTSAPLRTGEDGWLEEQLQGLLARLLQAHHRIQVEVAHVPALRRATREELYRRLHLARGYADVHLAEPITLHDMAGVAGLSPNHLLRTFRALFGRTPHQYLVERRIHRASELLRDGELPVTEICFAVGWQSPGSFSTLFRRHVGMSPVAYRRHFR